MITYARQLLFWGELSYCPPFQVFPPPLQLKPAPGAPPDPHRKANRFLDGIPAFPVA